MVLASSLCIFVTLARSTRESHDVAMAPQAAGRDPEKSLPLALALPLYAPQQTYRNDRSNQLALKLYSHLWVKESTSPFYPFIARLPARTALLEPYAEAPIIRALYFQQEAVLTHLSSFIEKPP